MAEQKILLLTHGGWGMSLVTGVKMILGPVDFVHEIPLMPEMTLQDYLAAVKEYVVTMPQGSIILTDMFGGTTTNVAAKLGRELKVDVISGLNAPMLIEACSQILYTEKLDADSILETGKKSMMNVVNEVMKSMKKEETNG